MLIHRAYRYRLEPTGAQAAQMARFAGCARYVWNRALAEQKARREAGLRAATYVDMSRWLTEWRNDPATYWLGEAPCDTQQQRLKDLHRAFRDYFRPASDPAKKGFPKFAKRNKNDSFRYPKWTKIESEPSGWMKVRLLKLGWVRYRSSRPLEGQIAQATVIREGRRWFISIQTKREVPDPAFNERSPVGIDLGIANFATLSDGTAIPPLNAFGSIRRGLARQQRRLERMKKGSNRRKKQVARIGNLHRKGSRIRRDFLHKTSTAIAKNHGVVVMEDLKVSNMVASAKGTIDAPGKNVKQKSGLNRAILEQGWYTFRRLLAYKLNDRGGVLVLVPPAYTSQRCAACGHTEADNRKSQAGFACLQCGHKDNADVNAAINILMAAGHAVAARGGIGHQPPCEART